MAAELDGPRLEPREGETRHLVVFLHGYGADGNDLIDIGRAWQPILPHTAFVSPHAPERVAGAPSGRQWYAINSSRPEERWQSSNASAAALAQFLDAELGRRNLSPSALALVGFSQGTQMALRAGLARPVAPAGIVGYSGMLSLPAEPENVAAAVRSRPPIILIHGDADQVIPIDALFQTTQILAELEIPAEWHISHGIGHGIDGEGLRHGGEFLRRRFGLPR
ncbi:MAG: alpha/beta hydrolase [Pseudorhodoplanes sp.]